MHTNIKVDFQPAFDEDEASGYFIECGDCQTELDAIRPLPGRKTLTMEQKEARRLIYNRPGMDLNNGWSEDEQEVRVTAARHMLATATDAEVERAVAALRG